MSLKKLIILLVLILLFILGSIRIINYLAMEYVPHITDPKILECEEAQIACLDSDRYNDKNCSEWYKECVPNGVLEIQRNISIRDAKRHST